MTTLPTFAGIAILATALWLLIRGLRGKRIGDEPRCRKCNYDLTTLTSERCPECGWTIVAEWARRGHRQRRPWSIALGAILLGSELLIAAVIARGVNWYPQAPTWVVLKAADLGRPAAQKEFESRYRSGMLSKGQIHAAAEVCLDKQKVSVSKRTRQFYFWIDLLSNFYAAGDLTPEQQTRYFEQFTGDAQLQVRPKIRNGDPLPLRIRIWQTSSITGSTNLRVSFPAHWADDVKVASLLADGTESRPKPLEFRDSRRSFYRSWTSGLDYDKAETSPDVDLKPGKYRVYFSGAIDLTQTGLGSVWSRQLELHADFEVLPEGAPDTVKLTVRPDLKQSIKSALQFRTYPVQLAGSFRSGSSLSPNNQPQMTLIPHIYAKRPFQIPFAFDVIARIDGEERRMATVTIDGPVPAMRCNTNVDYTKIDFDEISVPLILRPNPEVARETVDIFEIWGEEIVTDPVTLGRIQSPTTQESLAP